MKASYVMARLDCFNVKEGGREKLKRHFAYNVVIFGWRVERNLLVI